MDEHHIGRFLILKLVPAKPALENPFSEACVELALELGKPSTHLNTTNQKAEVNNATLTGSAAHST